MAMGLDEAHEKAMVSVREHLAMGDNHTWLDFHHQLAILGMSRAVQLVNETRPVPIDMSERAHWIY